jgi:hypothetical protein
VLFLFALYVVVDGLLVQRTGLLRRKRRCSSTALHLVLGIGLSWACTRAPRASCTAGRGASETGPHVCRVPRDGHRSQRHRESAINTFFWKGSSQLLLRSVCALQKKTRDVLPLTAERTTANTFFLCPCGPWGWILPPGPALLPGSWGRVLAAPFGIQLAVAVATKRVKRVNGHFTNRRQLPPRYPGGSAGRRVCLEDTKKDSSASGASSRSGADGGGTTQLAPYRWTSKQGRGREAGIDPTVPGGAYLNRAGAATS